MKIDLYLIISILGISLGYMQCNSSKKLSKPYQEYIKIGHGGGFAGIETVWTIHPNGMVTSEGQKDIKIKTRDVKQILENYHKLGLDTVKMNNPGNIYKFIEYQSPVGKINKLVWDSGKNEEKTLSLIYDHINYLIQKELK